MRRLGLMSTPERVFSCARVCTIGLTLIVAWRWFALPSTTRAADGTSPPLEARPTDGLSGFVLEYCTDCHDANSATAGLDLERLLEQPVSQHVEIWERVVRRLRARQMPPPEEYRPEETQYVAVLRSLESSLDAIAAARPDPGRPDTFRRLNRTEYRHTIRDLLGLSIDTDSLLPRDESSHGFDNVTVGDLSPALLERYITAAQQISRTAVGIAGKTPGGDTFRLQPDVTQESQVEGLPLGTRGGTVIDYTFPVSGEYELQIRLARDRNEQVEGARGTHRLEFLIDGQSQHQFTVRPPQAQGDHQTLDQHLHTRFRVKAGPHQVGVTFISQGSPLLESIRQPYEAHFNMHRHPRLQPAVFQVSITGPYEIEGPGDTPSRRRLFGHLEPSLTDDTARAEQVLLKLMRLAYRRPVTTEDVEGPIGFYHAARQAGGSFDEGIAAALSAVFVSPEFLFRIEREPDDLASGTAYRVSDLELASRLSFFLWSSIPDDELLQVATEERLHTPEVLRQQVRRMLEDERSQSLVTNFAGQWLYLRNLDAFSPDLRTFPDFDDNLRQAMRRETELFFQSIMREDQSVLRLLDADYTFLNERLAKHYGVPHVYGNRFRRVELEQNSHRGGLLRHGSILTVTSYATRTSPVIRGNWVLENLVGTPPPPPPANVPALQDNTVDAALSVRERLAQHRANEACAGCHNLMDPVGFALEQYDAVGRWRTLENGLPVDASGGLPDGSRFDGVEGLEQGILARPEMFVGTMTEKMLAFAVGRGVEYTDAPAVRRILRGARDEDYRFSAIVMGIVSSEPFQMRRTR